MHLLPFLIRPAAALVAVGDPSRDRTVYATIVLLVALGFAMIMLAVWLLRNTRPDPEVLAPLERMGQRKWRRADPVWQRRHLDEVRPGGADPLEPSSAPPATDDDFERGPQPIGFDDLVASSPTAGAAASELPAPAAGARPMDGPTAVGGGDGGAATIQPAGEHAAPDADDVEDITGEQDTEDFLSVRDVDGDRDHGTGIEADPDREHEPAPDTGPCVEPDAEDETDADAGDDHAHDVGPDDDDDDVGADRISGEMSGAESPRAHDRDVDDEPG